MIGSPLRPRRPVLHPVSVPIRVSVDGSNRGRPGTTNKLFISNKSNGFQGREAILSIFNSMLDFTGMDQQSKQMHAALFSLIQLTIALQPSQD